MDRPYIVCHILSALDGKIAGTFTGTKAAQAASEEYASIRSAYQAEAWLYGTTTTKEFTQYRKPVLEPSCGDVPDGDYIAETDLRFILLYFTGHGGRNRMGIRNLSEIWQTRCPCD